MKVFKDKEVRTCPRRIRERPGKALEEIAVLLRRRQLQRLRNIRENPSNARSNLCQFGRVVPHLPTVVIKACSLRQTAFKDLDERKKRKRLVSFVAMPDDASEANARRVFRH